MRNNKYRSTTYSIQSFIDVDVALWGNRLKENVKGCMGDEANPEQRRAWYECFKILRRELVSLDLDPDLQEEIFLVFEYELPRERGRRPDVLILSGKNLLVLEFKGYPTENQAAIDQAKHYARDLRHYHEQSHGLTVIPFLVLVSANDVMQDTDGVHVVSGDKLGESLKPLLTAGFADIRTWFYSEYAPLPSLIQSAQLIFKEKQFPQIKQAQSAGIPETLAALGKIASASENTNTHHLALITGVPGSGKTLVGLQLVFETYKQDQKQRAVFLSGNGPLVEVLQASLDNRHFVQSVHGFLKQYAHSNQQPSEHVIIYDEAQRAWDSEKVGGSSGRGANSEPIDFINIGSKQTHCLLIGLIGEGQEIHLGEESGMPLWAEAVKQSAVHWTIHCPEKIRDVFPGSSVEVVPEFNLTTSLRTHQAITLQSWVENLLDGKIPQARELIDKLFEEDYPIYITRELDKAKQYVKEKYSSEPDKTFGIIASSKNKILPKFGVKNDYNSSKSFSVRQYYVDSSHLAYCRNLNSVVTEFGCQGLELDLPILAWDSDWVYNNGWLNQSTSKAKDPYKLRKNSYRVLMTRGRDGLVIFVPEDVNLNTTYDVLIEAGCKILNTPVE